MRYQHIIWDWNGTLVDDAWLCVEVINELLQQRKLPTVTLADYREHFGFPVINYYHKLGFNFTDASFEEVSVEFIGLYHARRHECVLHPGVETILQTVRESGLSQSILSAYRQDMLESMVESYGLNTHFTRLAGLSDIYAHGKVESGRRHLQELGINSDAVVMVGDTVHDYEVAEALGIDCILLEHGHHPREKLQNCGTTVVKTMNEVLEHLHRCSISSAGPVE